MNQDVTHSCGHIERHQIVSQFAYLSDTKARQLTRQKCSDCYRAGKQAKAVDQATDDDATLADVTLPALVGSEKQVDWAGKIRRERLASALRKNPAAATHFIAQVEAKWWIDNRMADLATMPLTNGPMTA